MARKRKIDKDDLIELVMQDINNDIEAGDTTAVAELLKCCPIENLLTYDIVSNKGVSNVR